MEKSQALRVGFSEAKGEYVATLDADLQDSPEEIPIMINKLIESNLDMISGWKKKRYDLFFFKKVAILYYLTLLQDCFLAYVLMTLTVESKYIEKR